MFPSWMFVDELEFARTTMFNLNIDGKPECAEDDFNS